MNDGLIEAVAQAIGDSADEMHVSQLRLAAHAAIRAAAPLILDMAAEEADRFIEDDPLDTAEAVSSAIRQLKERFQ
jgi:hypothetical protein